MFCGIKTDNKTKIYDLQLGLTASGPSVAHRTLMCYVNIIIIRIARVILCVNHLWCVHVDEHYVGLTGNVGAR